MAKAQALFQVTVAAGKFSEVILVPAADEKSAKITMETAIEKAQAGMLLCGGPSLRYLARNTDVKVKKVVPHKD